MSSLSTAFDSALQQPGVVLFVAVEILLPGYNLRLLDGAGVVTFDSKTFVGRDATYGALGAATDYGDGVDDEAPSLTLTVLPPTNAAMADLADPTAQGSQVSVWVGALDPATGMVIGDPDLAFIGETDVPTRKVSQGSAALELTIVSVFDRFFDQNEGERLNNGFHQSVWAGELGLEFVSAVQRQMPWGSDAPRPALVTDVIQVGPFSSFEF